MSAEVDLIGQQARSKEGRGLSVRSGDSDKWITIQKNTFMNWVNLQLHGSGYIVENFETDFDDGVKLCALVEALQQRKIGKVIKKPINQHQNLENVTLALKAIAEDNVRLVNIGSEDVVNGNLKLILGLVWHLILRYQIGKSKIPPKKLMLAWLQAVIPECHIGNFTSDWNDGVALSALIDYCQPGLMADWRQLSRNNKLDNCRNAMHIAKESLNIPMLVRPEDFASPHLDELSGMTYLSYYMMPDSPGYFATRREIRKILQQGTIDNFTTDWNDGKLLCNLVKSIGGDVPGWPHLSNNSVENIQKGLDGGKRLGIEPIVNAQEMADPEVEHLGVMAYAAHYTKFRPVKIKLTAATFSGNLENAHVGQEKSFQIHLEEGSPDDVRGVLKGPNSSPPVRISWSGKTGHGSFTPVETGSHKLDIICSGDSISGCPVNFQVTADRSRVSCHPPDRCAFGMTTQLKVDTSAAGKGDVQFEAISPSGHRKNLSAQYSQGMYIADFNPSEVGLWKISVKYDGEPIRGSPFTVNVFDPSQVKVYGLEGGAVGRALTFNADATQAGEGKLRVQVVHAGVVIPSHISEERAGEYKVDFTPQGAGQYKVNVFMNDVEVRGSPYTLDIVDSSLVTLSGEGLSLVPVERPATFTVHTKGAGSGSVDVDIVGPGGKKVASKIRQKDSQIFEVEYVPRTAGDYKINVFFYGQLVKGSPFTCKAYDMGKLQISNMPDFGLPGNPITFNIDASQAGSGNIEIKVNEGRVACSVENLGNHRFLASFVPEGSKLHVVDMTFNEKPVEGSPWKVKIIDPQSVRIASSGKELVPVDQPTFFTVICGDAPTEHVRVEIAGPGGVHVPHQLSPDVSGNMHVSYIPHAVGDYIIHVKFGNREVAGSPLIAKAYSTKAISVTQLKDGIVGKPVFFEIDVRKAGEGQLQIMVNHGNLPNKVESREMGVYDIHFVPVEAGPQRVDILFNDEPLPGSPLICSCLVLEASVSGLAESVVAEREAKFVIRGNGVTSLSSEVIILSPTGEQLPSRLVQQTDGDYRVEWTPKEAGRHSVDVLFAGQQVKGSPFYIEVFDVSKIRVDNFYNGNVGEPAGFHVNTSRAGKCEQTVRVVSPSGRNLPVDVKEGKNFTYNVSYVPTESGQHRVYLSYNNMELPGSPFTQEVSEGVLPPAYGDGLYRGEEDKTAIFYIDARGMRGEPSVQVDGPNSIAKCSIDPQPDGQYAVTYIPVEVGMFDVQVKWNGKEIPGSPFHPKVVCARKVQVVGGWQHYMDAKERVHLVVNEEKHIPFDVSEAGPGKLTAEVKGPGGLIPVNVDSSVVGRSTINFTPRQEGVHNIHVYWSDTPLVNSPFHGFAVGGAADPSKVILSGRGLKEAIIREEAEFMIDASHAGPGEPEVQLTGVKAEINVFVTPLGGGKFRCTYIPVLPGAYLLHISWNGRQLRGSPYKVNVIGAVHPDKVVVSGEGLKGGVLGRDLDVRIDTRKAGPGELTAYCMGPTRVAHCELEDHKDGTFRLVVRPQEAGRHVLQVKYGDEHVTGSPFAFKVSAQPDASKVRVSGPGVEHGILATFQSRFVVETRGAGAGQLTVRIRGPKGAFQVEMYRDSQKDRTILCRYDPTETGLYIVSVRWSGRDVPGSPFQVNIVDTQAELEQLLHEQSYNAHSFHNSSFNSRASGGYQWRDDI